MVARGAGCWTDHQGRVCEVNTEYALDRTVAGLLFQPVRWALARESDPEGIFIVPRMQVARVNVEQLHKIHAFISSLRWTISLLSVQSGPLGIHPIDRWQGGKVGKHCHTDPHVWEAGPHNGVSARTIVCMMTHIRKWICCIPSGTPLSVYPDRNISAMNLHQLLPTTVLLLAAQPTAAQGPSRIPVAEQLANPYVQKSPEALPVFGGARMDMVNARYEPCYGTEDVHYLRVITPYLDGYSVHIVGVDGLTRVHGITSDALGLVPHGLFRYYDSTGALRSEGAYVNGVKTGTWHRYDDLGLALTDREYDGLDWEGQQLKLGLTSMSRN
jgi:hypothetical protein